MRIEQVYTLVNNATREILGETAVLQEDLSNVVDIGNQIFDNTAVDSYVRSLINHIGKVIFVNRVYAGSAPSVLVDAWEFGSVLEKVSIGLQDATENESWELQDGASYDVNIFTKPKGVVAKFFNKKITFEIPISIAEKQVKQSFSSATQLNSFVSMIYNAVDKSMTVKTDALIMATINVMTAMTLYNEYPTANYSAKSGIRAVNLLYLYNTKYGTNLTPENALTTPEFIRFASYTMGVYVDRMKQISKLFNIGGQDRFTPSDMLHVVMLSDFAKSADAYLQSDTFHDEYTRIPNAETVAYWQGSGVDYGFNSISKIDIVTPDDNHTVTASGILGVMFDRDACMVANIDKRTTTSYNAKGEFFNNWYKYDMSNIADTNENFVVFFVA